MNVLDQQLAEGRMLAVMSPYRCLLAKAKEDISAMLRQCRDPYVALSWGKQSIVMAHMAFEIDTRILCVHWTGEDAELIADFNAVQEAFCARWPLNYIECWRGLKLRDAISAYEAGGNHDGVLVGLAAEESKARRYTLAKGDRNNIYRYADGRLRCCPLARWTVLDLAAYIATNELPLLNTYRRFGLDARTATGCRPGSATSKATGYMSSSNAAEMRRRWKKRGLL